MTSATEDFEDEVVLNGHMDDDEMEVIDDTEYGIPPIHSLPTLEDILNEDPLVISEDEDDELGDEATSKRLNGSASLLKVNGKDELKSVQANETSLLLDTLSLHSSLSDASKANRSGQSNKRSSKCNSSSSILRRVLLKGVSSQISRASDKSVNAGHPTCMTAQSLVAVGFTHGFVFVFDTFQVLKWSLGGPKYGSVFGPVSCLALTSDSTRLLVGFAKGQLVEFELTTGKTLLDINDAHPIGNAVTRLRYIQQDQAALVGDSGGSLFELRFKQKLGMGRGYTSRCIFSGSRGEVFTFEPLSTLNQPTKLHFEPIIALATISKVIVLLLKPRIKVLFSHSLVGRADCLPLLSWQVVMVSEEIESKEVRRRRRDCRPLLAFARHNTLHVYQMMLDNEESETSSLVKFQPVHKLVLPYLLLHMAFLSPRCLYLLSENESVHLLDLNVDEGNELEMQNLDKLGLVYQSSFFKGLATGNNVSKAMAMAGQKAVYESIVAINEQLLFLGKQQLQVMIMRNWEQRIDFLVEKANEVQQAILLAQEMFMDPGKALLGLKGSLTRKKEVVSTKLKSVVQLYLKAAMSTNFPLEGDLVVLANYFDEVVPPCVSSCLLVEDFDLLFDEVWPTFELDPFAKAKFLECLEQSFITDRLIRPPVQVMQAFVSHYTSLRRFEALEACLTHVHVFSLDLHQVMSVSRKHLLTDVIIYVNNYGLNNFLTPLQELMAVLRRELRRNASKKTDDQPLVSDPKVMKMGQKLLLYVSYCLTGKAYFSHWDNSIADEALQAAKFDVYNNLIALHLPHYHREDEDDLYGGEENHDDKSSERSNKMDSDETYPYLRSLLLLDTQCFLNVLLMAFEEEADFNTELGLCRKQRLIDALIQVMVVNDDNNQGLRLASSSSSFNPTQLAQLFTFVAQQLVSDSRMKLSVSKDLFQQLLMVLTTFDHQESKSQQRQEREEALLQLLKAGGDEYFDRDKLLQRAEEAHFFQIQSHIYEQDKNYNQCLRCYLQDPIRRHQTFHYLERVQWPKDELQSSLIANLELLVAFDVEQTVTMAMEVEDGSMRTMVKKLSDDSLTDNRELLFSFLKTCFESYSQVESRVINSHELEELVHDPKIIQLTVKLMNEKQPELVVPFLQKHLSQWNEVVEPECLLEVCKSQGNLEAQAFLLERSDRLDEALSVLLTHLKLKLRAINKKTVIIDHGEWAELRARLTLVLRFYQRVFIDEQEDKRKETTNSASKERVWRRMLDLITDTGNNEDNNDNSAFVVNDGWRALLREFLVDTSRSVTAECLIDAIFMGCDFLIQYLNFISPYKLIFIFTFTTWCLVLQNESLLSKGLIDMAHFVPFLFDSLRHECSLVTTSRDLVQQDRCQRLQELQLQSRRATTNSALRPCSKERWSRRDWDAQEPICRLCQRDLLSKTSNMSVAFGSGQIFHVGCVVENGGRSIDNLGVVKYNCNFFSDKSKEKKSHTVSKVTNSLRNELAIEEGLAMESKSVAWGLDQLEELRSLCKRNNLDNFEDDNSVFQQSTFALKLTPNHSKDSWF